MIRQLARSRWFLPVCGGLWLIAVACGMHMLLEYASTPGEAGDPPAAWPASSRIPPPAGRPVLLLMAHPRCPCTRASLEELARLMSRVPGRLDARVVFYAPRSVSEDWWKTDLWAGAAAIPGVEPVLDRDAVESRRFGTETSGHVLLYDAKGRLLFSGGITVARGHEGDNAGLDAVEALVSGRNVVRRRSPVFGCALHDWSASSAGREGSWKR